MPKSFANRRTLAPFIFVTLLTAIISVSGTLIYVKSALTNQQKPSEIPKTTTTTTVSTPDLVESYLKSPFKIIKTIVTPDKKQMIVFATERDGNQDGCGSIFSSPTCYIFMEPLYFSDAAPVQLITKWSARNNDQNPTYGGFNTNTETTFVGNDRLRFTVGEGDGGAGYYNLMELNYRTGNMTIIKHTESNGAN